MPLPESKYDSTPAQDFEPTVLHFRGLCTDINEKTETNSQTSKDYQVLIFDFAELEVIEAKEPYNMPVMQVELRPITIPGTQYEVWKNSLEKTGFKGDLNSMIGKRQEWHYTSAMLNLPKRIENPDGTFVRDPAGGYENRQGKCWQVVTIEGVENTSNKLGEAVVAMAEGKTDLEFKSAFMSDLSLQGLTSYDEVAGQVMQNTHLPLLVQAGVLSKDSEGRYHKV